MVLLLLALCITEINGLSRISKNHGLLEHEPTDGPKVHKPIKLAESNAGVPSGAHLLYFGGVVLPNIKVVTLFLGPNVAYKSELKSFYDGIVNSPYIDWLSEYNTPNQTIGRGSWIGTHADTSFAVGNYSDANIQTYLKDYIAHGVRSDGLNTYYVMHFAPGITITVGGFVSCHTFCGYHSSYPSSNGHVFYGVIPDVGQPGCACSQPSNIFSYLSTVASHELVETITDGAVGSHLAWYDKPNNMEIGDLCAWLMSTVKTPTGTYTVQLEWSNSRNTC